MENLTFVAVAGIVTSIVTALINRSTWTSKTKVVVAGATATVLTIAGVAFQLYPDAWATIATGLVAVFGVSQAVYLPLKPLFKQLEEATTGSTKTVDELDAIIQEALTAANDEAYAQDGYPTLGKHDAQPVDLDGPPVGDTLPVDPLATARLNQTRE